MGYTKIGSGLIADRKIVSKSAGLVPAADRNSSWFFKGLSQNQQFSWSPRIPALKDKLCLPKLFELCFPISDFALVLQHQELQHLKHKHPQGAADTKAGWLPAAA